MRKRGSKSQDPAAFQGHFVLPGAHPTVLRPGKFDLTVNQKEKQEESFFSERMAEPNRSDLAHLYYHLRTPTPDNTVPRRLRPLSLAGSGKRKARSVREDAEEIVDQMEMKLQNVQDHLSAFETIHDSWTLLQRLSDSPEWPSVRRIISSFRRTATLLLQAYEADKAKWASHVCPVVTSKPPDPIPPALSLADQLAKQSENKRLLDDLEAFIETDIEAYKELQTSIEALLQVHSSGTAEYLKMIYQEMSQKHSLPETSQVMEVEHMELQEWENSLRLRFK